MLRILRSLTTVLLLATVGTPLLELLDRWDAVAGLARDTEMHVFCWVLAISLILIVVHGLSRMFFRALGCLRGSTVLAPARRSMQSASISLILFQLPPGPPLITLRI